MIWEGFGAGGAETLKNTYDWEGFGAGGAEALKNTYDLGRFRRQRRRIAQEHP